MADKFYNNGIMVSIHCLVFNQEPYLRQCLDGFVMQKTNFKFEAIVHDDASSDSSAAIIREYAEKYPDIIKPIYETENQYSKHNGSIRRIMNAHMLGKYVAFCEGDDYWTDPNKLQRQFDFLESHSDYTISAENGMILFTATNATKLFSEENEKDLSIEDLLIKRRFPTASVLCNGSIFREIYKKNVPAYDTVLWTFLAQKGKVHFNPVVSSVYRRGSGMTEQNKIKWAYTSESINKLINSLFHPSRKVRQARSRILFFDFKSGWKAAKSCGNIRESYKLFFKMLSTPKIFLKDCLSCKWKYYKRKLLTKFWNFYYKVMPVRKLAENTDRKIPVVVSLTSYPARFSSLHLCLKSLLNQTLSADKIVLYLDKTVSLNQVPKKILDLQKKGLEIKNICSDLKPHNKYFYAMQEFPNAAIITVDDDMIYSRDVVESLYKSYLNNPNAVSARRIHQISRRLDGHCAPYNAWKIEVNNLKNGDKDVLATGVGGVLYPPGVFDFSQPYLQTATIMQHCQTADDIWLAFIEKVNDIPICYVPNRLAHPYKIVDKILEDTALRNQNVFADQNDFFIQKCENFFKIDL